MVSLTDNGIKMLVDIAGDKQRNALRVLPIILKKFENSKNFVVKLHENDRGMTNLSRSQWFDGLKVLRTERVIVKTTSGFAVVNSDFITKY